MKKYNRIDIVIPNAGVTERGSFTSARMTATNGVPMKPDTTTLEVNLIGVLYSAFDNLNNYVHRPDSLATRLALFYLLENHHGSPDALKAIVFVGSMCQPYILLTWLTY